jgi:CheY-like chemotaxis protein
MPTALIVDDEPEANLLLARLIEFRGYRVDSVFTGAEALTYLEANRPDIIFLDLMLPEVNGYDVCRTIKSDPRLCLIPVVIVTARLAAENRSRSYQLGAHAYVGKPYTPDQIFAALASGEASRSELEHCGDRGELCLGGDDDRLERDLSRLLCLLCARTLLDEEAIGRIAAVLRRIGQDARRWAQRNRVPRVATMYYQIDQDRMTLTVRDESGWFAGGDFTEASAGFEPRLDDTFEEAGPSESGDEILLVKHLARREATN